MFDNVNLLSFRALQEASKVLVNACSSTGAQTLLDACLPGPAPAFVGDAIIVQLDKDGLLNDQTMQLFDSKRMRLNSVHITPGALKTKTTRDELTFSGLQVLRTQNLRKVHYSGQRKFDASGGTQLMQEEGILSVLNDWTLHNLLSLELPYNELNNVLVLRITCFRNLRFLNVASTQTTFNSASLEICISGMPHLEGIDISETSVSSIEALRTRRETLRFLSLYGNQALFSPSTPDILCCLNNLKHLDISLPAEVPVLEDLNQFHLASFLTKLPYYCPDIEYLDISGNQRLSLDSGRPALLSCASTLAKLKFIGAAIDGDVCHWLKGLDNFQRLRITGSFSIEAIVESLHCYSLRPSYLHHSLVALYNFIGDLEEDASFTKIHLPCLISVIEVCRLWPHDRLVQLSGTASVYALTRGSLSTKLPRRILIEVVKIATSVLSIFSQLQLVKNAVLLLCNDAVLDCGADWLACATAVLYRLRQIGVSNAFIAKMSVLIISVLASRLTANEAASLMSFPDNWQTLLAPVMSACQENDELYMTESTALRYCLSALWNLTDENPLNCRRFVDAGGLQIYAKLLKVYREHADKIKREAQERREPEFVIDYEGKLLGLLNNVSEVSNLRAEIVDVPDFVNELIWRLHQIGDTERHYFAGGIIANILNGGAYFPKDVINFEELSAKLSSCVKTWNIPAHEHVAYRSFKPFIPLIKDPCLATRHWALWAISLVTTKNPERYASMLKRDGIFALIRDLLVRMRDDELLWTLTERLITVLKRVDDGSLAKAMEVFAN